MTIKASRLPCRSQAIVHYRAFMEALGYDLDQVPAMSSDASGKDTATRAVDAYIEFLSKAQESFQFTVFPSEGARGIIAVTHIEFFSLCCHHMLPYSGVAHVGYIPNGMVCGLSKIVRVVDHYSHRPSIQEVLTSKVATFLQEQLNPAGCGVVIEANHGCMTMRGVERPGHVTVTSDMRGSFQDSSVRADFMSMIERAKSR